MSLKKESLSKKLMAAEKSSLSGKLEKNEEKKLKEKCDLIAQAIDDYIKSATILIDVYPGIPVATGGTAVAQTGATTGPGQGASKEIF